MGRYIVGCVIVCCLFFSAALLHAAPVDVPLILRVKDVDELVSIEGEGDFISERDLRAREGQATGKLEQDIYSLKFSYSKGGKFNAYGMVGQAQNMKFDTYSAVDKLTYEYDEAVVYGVGASGILHEFEKARCSVFADALYRQTDRLNYESFTRATTKYFAREFEDLAKARYSEWQLAFGLAKKIGYFLPYGGIKYSDVKLKSNVTVAGTRYEMSAEGKHNVGFFLGGGLLLDEFGQVFFEIRFADEKAYTIKAGINF